MMSEVFKIIMTHREETSAPEFLFIRILIDDYSCNYYRGSFSHHPKHSTVQQRLVFWLTTRNHFI